MSKKTQKKCQKTFWYLYIMNQLGSILVFQNKYIDWKRSQKKLVSFHKEIKKLHTIIGFF